MGDSYYYRHGPLSPLFLETYLSNHSEPNEAIADLRIQLLQRLEQIAKKVLTPFQHEVYKLTRQGLNRRQVAEQMGRGTANSVTKSLMGNAIYRNGCYIQTNGGLYKKLRNATAADPVCQELLRKIGEERARPDGDGSDA